MAETKTVLPPKEISTEPRGAKGGWLWKALMHQAARRRQRPACSGFGLDPPSRPLSHHWDPFFEA